MESNKTRIAELHRQGHSVGAIAAQLKLARNTVAYHVAKLGQPAEVASFTPSSPADVVRHVRTRDAVKGLLHAGMAHSEIARRLNLNRSTVTYHARRLGKPIDARCARRYDWSAVQAFYDGGASVREAAAAFGFPRKAGTQQSSAATSFRGLPQCRSTSYLSPGRTAGAST